MIRATAAMGVIVIGISVTPAHAAITPDVAKLCRGLMIKAHPTEVFSSKGSAASQRAYFAQCVHDHAAQDEGQLSTTGSGSPR